MNAPTLIIGLGGTGSKVALKVSEQVKKQVSEDQRERIAFAVFDTDVNELREIKKNNSFVHTIQTSTRLSVGEYLDIDHHARDSWFPINAILNSKTLTEGAGQVRAVSRMAFETALRAGKLEELHKAIESLYKLEGEEYEQALRVIIVSSLAGGTGSGLILPVALYIKNYLATRFRQSSNITRGFFLLPEIFYGAIPGNAERNNLKSNAYATLREIDAFMMKGDSTLPENYQNSVKIEFPNVSSDEYEEYNIRPYDFCFLFDAQNVDGKKLNSFNQYLEHAANCIFAQSIGPMNKRSNSSEDNTIRKLVSERGRNRYAGAGTSMLIYPTEDIKRYLALNWAKESVSGIWLMFDKQFRELVKRNAELKRQGVHVADVKEAPTYIATVEAEASNNNYFARAIVDSCALHDESGVTVTGYKWDAYLKALEDKVKNEGASSGKIALDGERGKASDAINNIDPDVKDDDLWNAFVNAYNSIRVYEGVTRRRCEEIGRTVAVSIFGIEGADVVNRKEDFQVETFMRNEKGDFIHPCAVRYFLYKVMFSLEAQLHGIQKKVDSDLKYFRDFEKNNFDDPDTEEEEGIEENTSLGKRTLIDKIRKRFSTNQEELLGHYREYMRKIDDYRTSSVYVAVLEEGIDYVKRVSEAFESFFKSFDSKVSNMEKEIHQLEGKHVESKGLAARYVCASKECLHAMRDNMPYTGGSNEIDSKLAEAIYLRVHAFSKLSVQSDSEDYFSAIFDKDIVGHYTKQLMAGYAGDIDIDIITAIEKEFEYEKHKTDPDETKKYVEDVIRSAKVLAAPFIEKPIGEEKDPINSCTFNKFLSPKDDSPRAQLIEEQLYNFGGEGDEDIAKNMILFYKSFYGLRANDLSKFAPPLDGETHKRSGGEYFKAYYELVSKVHPVPSKSKVITPHIDRWWHNVTMMPDLDEGNQEKQLNDIYSSFFWALVSKKIGLFENGTNQMAYKIRESLIDKEDDMTLYVSNGTFCDQIYEVLDALAIYPELVYAVLNSTNNMIEQEVEAGKTAFSNELYDNFESFTIDLLEDVNSTKIRSIFELPFILKNSMTPELYNEKDSERMLETAIAETKKLFKNFSSENDYTNNLSRVFMEQFDRLVKNLESESTEEKNIFQDYLFTRVCEILSAELKGLGLVDNSKTIKNKCEELKKKAVK